MKHHELERYAFIWSEVRLVLAGVALILGGIPFVFLVFPSMYGVTAPLLKICWLVSGAASAYLGWRWYDKKMHVFGGKDNKDSVAFAILVVTGLNLGVTGIIGSNIGMSIIGGRVVFFVAGIIYLYVAYHLYNRWKKSGRQVF